jgi:glycosyltransferase involved in cell wall biosynthesis
LTQAPSPLVSVIVPAYNVAEFIGDALNSVLAQTFSDYEIIVINDGSPDTEALERALAPYMSRIVYIKTENQGVSAARNTAIRAARGSLLAFLDGDDIWLAHYLEVQVKMIQDDPTIDVLYPNVLMFGEGSATGEEFMTHCPSKGPVTFESLLSQECNVSNCSIARRDAIFRAGLYDESLRSVEDFDLWLRVIKTGGRIAYHRDVLARYRRRRGSLTADPVWLTRHVLNVMDKVRDTMELTPSENAVLERQYRRFKATLSFHEGKHAFFSGDTDQAINKFTEANQFFRKPKTAFTLMMLRIAPRLLLFAYNLRDRFYFRMVTKY